MVELLRRLFNFQPYNLSRLKTRAIIRGNNALENTRPVDPPAAAAPRGERAIPPKASEPGDTRGFCSDSSLLARASVLVFPKVISRLDRVKERNGL